MKLSGKVAAITGAARGIGKACAERFLKDGVRVVISDVDNEALEKTVAELGSPRELHAVHCHVARRADVDRVVATAVREFGRLDIMVNNAGVARNRDILEISEEEFDEIIGINLKGAFFGVQAAAKQMIAQGGGGVIINMSSVNALLAIPTLATYAISKGGMKQLTSVAAVALEEAAQVDGAKPWQTFWYVILPMMRPGLLTVAIIVGLNAWNEFVIAVTFLQNDSNVTAIVRFYNLTGQYSTDWGEMLAAAVTIVLPIVAIFVLLQRQFIDGMTSGAVKS